MFWLIVFCSLFSTAGRTAQRVSSEALDIIGKVGEEEVDPNVYKMGPGDLLEISLLGSVNFSYEAEVDLEGNIGLQQVPLAFELEGPREGAIANPVVSSVKVSGFTLSKAEDLIRAAYSLLYPRTPCEVRLIRARAFYLPVLGAVVRPGLVMVSALERVTQALLDAGGVQPGAALSRVELHKREDGVERVNLFRFLAEGNSSDNPLVAQGTKLFVPWAEKTVRVKGAIVTNPVVPLEEGALASQPSGMVPRAYQVNETVIEYTEGDSVGSIILKAGGLQNEADISGMKIERDGIWIASDFSTLVEPGDILYVPFFQDEVYVEGAVTNPGPYPFVPGKTVGDYVSIAGGPLERGKRKVYLLKDDGKKEKVSLRRPVSRGERFLVPWVSIKWWEDYLQIASLVTTVIVTWLTIRK